jgi:hypothetical protein
MEIDDDMFIWNHKTGNTNTALISKQEQDTSIDDACLQMTTRPPAIDENKPAPDMTKTKLSSTAAKRHGNNTPKSLLHYQSQDDCNNKHRSREHTVLPTGL